MSVPFSTMFQESFLALPKRLFGALAVADIDEDSAGADDVSVPRHGNGINEDREGASVLSEGHVLVAFGPPAGDGVPKRLHGAGKVEERLSHRTSECRVPGPRA